MVPRPRLASALALVAILLVTGPASAGPATDRLNELFEAANRILTDPAGKERPQDRLARISWLVHDAGDWEAAAARALGREWQERSRAEQAEFARLFAGLVERTLLTILAGRAHLTDGMRVQWRQERAEGEEVIVPTTVPARNGQALPVEYRMGRRNGAWRIRDVIIEGVSLVDNYRAQVAAVLRRASFADLLSDMRARVVDGVATAGLPPRETPRAAETLLTAAAATEPPATPPPAAAPEPARPAPAVKPAPSPAPAPAAPRDAPATARPAAPGRPAPAASATSARSPASKYWVQVGAFKTVQATAPLVSRLRAWTYSIVSGPLTHGATARADALKRVLVGPFTQRAEATRALQRLKAVGVAGFVTEDHR